MAAYGQIKFKNVDREEIHILSFGNRSAWSETEWYIRRECKTLEILDSFWGYALYKTKDEAIHSIKMMAR